MYKFVAEPIDEVLVIDIPVATLVLVRTAAESIRDMLCSCFTAESRLG